jgi:lysophospholipase L1-like esterase
MAKKFIGALVVTLSLASHLTFAQNSGEKWVGTWSTSLVARPQTPPPPAAALPPFMPNQCPAPAAPPPAATPGQTFAPLPFPQFTNQTLRQIVHTSIAGSRARIVVSNTHGTAPLVIGAASIALRDKDSAVKSESVRKLTFSGRPTVTVPSRAIVYSDPVDLGVAPTSDLAIDLYLPGATDTSSPVSMHGASFQTNYISETGNHTGAATLPVVGTIQSWFFLSRVEVLVPADAPVVVAFGDSITDGTRSTPDTNRRWPDQLLKRSAAASQRNMAMLNAGIAGNRVLGEGVFTAGINALARFDSDVLSHPGVTHVVIMEGINDIGNARTNGTPTAEDIIAGHKQLIERAHARGIKAIGATLTPFWGAAYYTDVGEAKRQAVNEWIRTGGSYDGVIDFDKATRDPAEPKKFKVEFDSCDHLHPNDAGYEAMAAAIDLSQFARGQETATARRR